MTTSIAPSLGIGSGLDIVNLVKNLSEAQKAPREALIAKREELNQARVSSLAEVSGAIDSFATALSSLVTGGTLFAQPSVSAPDILSATTVRGARIGNLSAEIEVVQLAKAQTLQSATLPSRSAPIGQGELSLTTAKGSFAITVDAGNDSLDGLARAINDKGAGVTASVVTDANGARLVLKGATGEAQAFSLGVTAGAGSGIERFAYGAGVSGGMLLAQAAQDAVVRLDNVEVRRASNSFSDLIPGVQIDLKKATPGTVVSLGVTRPTAATEQAVQDFVAAYNELQSMIAAATKAGVNGDGGPLRGDLGIRELQRQLAQLPTQILSSQGNGPRNLAEIGVRTNRDGTLGVNLTQLKEALASNPDGVEALFNPSQFSSDPAIAITSPIGRVKPGVYTLTNIVPSDGVASASGQIDGLAMTGIGTGLIAPIASKAVGLALSISGPVASATITVDSGLGGALQSIRDALRARNGAFAGTQERLRREADKIADEREVMEARAETYYNQLLTTFTSMERQVSAFKATQSYLDQQVKMWTADRG